MPLIREQQGNQREHEKDVTDRNREKYAHYRAGAEVVCRRLK